MAGLVVGTFTAIGLVLVSPNMTYPLQVKATQQNIIEASASKTAKLNTELAAAADPATQEKIRKEIADAGKARKIAEDTIAKTGSGTTSLVGLEWPFIELRNPGLISIPLGFLAVFVFSMFYRDPRAEAMWDELYVRSNTGIGRSGAAAH